MMARRREPPREAEILRLDEARERLARVEDLSLEELAAQANEGHRLALTMASEAVRGAVRVGRLLLEAKRRLPHGAFGPWLTEHWEQTDRQARRYMRLADSSGLQGELENGHECVRFQEGQGFSRSLRQALAAIGQPVEGAGPVARRRAEERDRAAREADGEVQDLGTLDLGGPAEGAGEDEHALVFDTGPFERAADLALQAATRLARARLNLPPVYDRLRDAAVQELRRVAGQVAQLGRDVREVDEP